MKEGDNKSVSEAKEACGIKEIRGKGEERGIRGEGTKWRGSRRTTRGEKPCEGDATI